MLCVKYVLKCYIWWMPFLYPSVNLSSSELQFLLHVHIFHEGTGTV